MYTLKRNTLVRNYPVYYNQFDVSFNVRPLGLVRTESSILHLTQGRDNRKYGDRIPSVSFLPRSRRLKICSAVNNNRNFCYLDRTNLPPNRVSTVRIFQTRTSKGQFIYAVVINSRIKRILANRAPATFHNVKLYLGDPWLAPAKATVKKCPS